MRQAFRQPGFTRLYAGLTASMFGDSAMLLVLSMWVKTITGSNSMTTTPSSAIMRSVESMARIRKPSPRPSRR